MNPFPDTFRARTEDALRRDNRYVEREPRTRAPMTDAELDAVYRAFLKCDGLDLCHALLNDADEARMLTDKLRREVMEAKDAR